MQRGSVSLGGLLLVYFLLEQETCLQMAARSLRKKLVGVGSWLESRIWDRR